MKIQNETLREFLMILLNQPSESVTDEDTQKIESVRISTINEKGEHTEKFDDLNYFKNLNRIIIANSMISVAEIEILSSIAPLLSIEFEHCTFENDSLLTRLTNIRNLTFNNCMINDYNFLNELDKLVELQIINPYDETVMDFRVLSKMQSLRKLYLERCILTGFDSAIFPSLEELSLLNTAVDDLQFINKCPKLSLVYIPEKYINDSVVRANTKRIEFKTNLIELAFDELESTNIDHRLV